jgi:hypothetical protein
MLTAVLMLHLLMWIASVSPRSAPSTKNGLRTSRLRVNHELSVSSVSLW